MEQLFLRKCHEENSATTAGQKTTANSKVCKLEYENSEYISKQLKMAECALPQHIKAQEATTSIIIGCVVGLVVCLVGCVVYKKCVLDKKKQNDGGA